MSQDAWMCLPMEFVSPNLWSKSNNSRIQGFRCHTSGMQNTRKSNQSTGGILLAALFSLGNSRKNIRNAWLTLFSSFLWLRNLVTYNNGSNTALWTGRMLRIVVRHKSKVSVPAVVSSPSYCAQASHSHCHPRWRPRSSWPRLHSCLLTSNAERASCSFDDLLSNINEVYLTSWAATSHLPILNMLCEAQW